MRLGTAVSIVCALIAAVLGGGCSKPNDHAVILTASGKHAANWMVDHRGTFVNNPNPCYECHGGDLHGGVPQVSCFSSDFNGTTCHPNGPGGHLPGWRDPGLHGAAAKAQPGNLTGFPACQRCHGADFTGGAARVSCFSAAGATGSCHVRDGVAVGAPHAPLPWKTYPAPNHIDTVDDAAGLNAAVCALCHTAGKNLRTPIITSYAAGAPGCFNSTLCHGVMGHSAGWIEGANHGSVAKSNLTYCQQCHADDPSGGPGSNPRFNVKVGRLVDGSNTGCEVCHAPRAPHPPLLQVPAAFGSLKMNNPLGTPWYLHNKVGSPGFDACMRCHGANLDGVGGAEGATGCAFCHRSGLPDTLQNCTSCHGNPPDGTAYPNRASAHSSHRALNTSDRCSVCHSGIGSVSLDHFNRAKANASDVQPDAVVFGGFAGTGGLKPDFSKTTFKCTNVYCHGASLPDGGTNKTPVWNQTDYLTKDGCGTCHGFPPANTIHAGVKPEAPCKGCHTHVNSTNTGFDDPTKHVNGVIDVGTQHAYPNPGSAHASSAGAAPFPGCVANGCHTNGDFIGVYPPVTAGAPPDCRGCHVKQSPGNSCGSCHGTASTSVIIAGRPNGSVFPDVAGHHNSVPEHAAEPCTTCHGSNGTGQSRHGLSNGAVHDADNVVVVLSSWNATTGTCNIFTCHGHTHGRRDIW